MNPRHIIVQALLLAILVPCGAAQTRLGVICGLSVPNLSGGSNEITQDYRSRLAPHFGITVERDIGGHFSLQPALVFDGQGGQRTGLQPITSTSLPPLPSGGYYYADFKNTSVLNYIELPMLVRYRIGAGALHFQVNAGPYVGYLVGATQKTSGTSAIYVDRNRTPLEIPVPPDYTQMAPVPPQSFDASTDVMDSIHRMNAGIEGGVGMDLDLTAAHTLSLEVHGLYGVTNIQRYAEDGTNHTGNLLVSLAYTIVVPWM